MKAIRGADRYSRGSAGHETALEADSNERPRNFPCWSVLMHADRAAQLSTLGRRPPRLIRVLIVEGMSLLRGTLAAALSREEDVDVAAAVASVDEAVPVSRAVQPDVTVINVDLLAGRAAGVTAQLAAASPRGGTVILADPDDRQALRAAWRAEVRGLIGKDTRPGHLADSIRRVARGERVVDPALVAAAVHARPDPFTRRERDVLRVMALGLPSAEIARQLGIAKGTVDQYVSTILRKTGTRNRLEAVHIAQESGWLPATGRSPADRFR
jgi:two-component system response regulator DesR